MKPLHHRHWKASQRNGRTNPAVLALIGGGVLIVLVALLFSRSPTGDAGPAAPPGVTSANPAREVRAGRFHRVTHGPKTDEPDGAALTAEEIVARKLQQFGRNRRDLVHALAGRFNVEVPDDVERFFAALEGGDWAEIDAAHNALLQPGAGLNQPRSPELHQIWRPIQEAWGAAKEAHTWPAQKLLDYGNAVLGSLRPGMIYVGGTDPGCFIPTFLNETSQGERHITLTQNALADSTYLEYLNFLYADRLGTLTSDDSQRGFQEYIADAQKRLEHDQQFPDEPKQLKPGEDVRLIDGRVQVSGQVAVMAINERLLQRLMEKNPDAAFAIEQSFPFKSTYAEAAPLGPIMELRVSDETSALTSERAAQTVAYWQDTSRQFATDPEAADSLSARLAYGKLAAEQAALLLDRKFTAEAEQAFRIAVEIAPTSPEAVFRYAELLAGQNRLDDAIRVAAGAVQSAPQNDRFADLLRQLKASKAAAPPANPPGVAP